MSDGNNKLARKAHEGALARPLTDLLSQYKESNQIVERTIKDLFSDKKASLESEVERHKDLIGEEETNILDLQTRSEGLSRTYETEEIDERITDVEAKQETLKEKRKTLRESIVQAEKDLAEKTDGFFERERPDEDGAATYHNSLKFNVDETAMVTTEVWEAYRDFTLYIKELDSDPNWEKAETLYERRAELKQAMSEADAKIVEANENIDTYSDNMKGYVAQLIDNNREMIRRLQGHGASEAPAPYTEPKDEEADQTSEEKPTVEGEVFGLLGKGEKPDETYSGIKSAVDETDFSGLEPDSNVEQELFPNQDEEISTTNLGEVFEEESATPTADESEVEPETPIVTAEAPYADRIDKGVDAQVEKAFEEIPDGRVTVPPESRKDYEQDAREKSARFRLEKAADYVTPSPTEQDISDAVESVIEKQPLLNTAAETSFADVMGKLTDDHDENPQSKPTTSGIPTPVSSLTPIPQGVQPETIEKPIESTKVSGNYGTTRTAVPPPVQPDADGLARIEALKRTAGSYSMARRPEGTYSSKKVKEEAVPTTTAAAGSMILKRPRSIVPAPKSKEPETDEQQLFYYILKTGLKANGKPWAVPMERKGKDPDSGLQEIDLNDIMLDNDFESVMYQGSDPFMKAIKRTNDQNDLTVIRGATYRSAIALILTGIEEGFVMPESGYKVMTEITWGILKNYNPKLEVMVSSMIEKRNTRTIELQQDIANPEEYAEKLDSESEKIKLTLHNEASLYNTGNYVMSPVQLRAVMPLMTTLVGAERVKTGLNGEGKDMDSKEFILEYSPSEIRDVVDYVDMLLSGSNKRIEYETFAKAAEEVKLD